MFMKPAKVKKRVILRKANRNTRTTRTDKMLKRLITSMTKQK
jgi:hypothetical protein